MKKIIHFHPNRMYSEYFVEPLIKFEENMGNKVTLVNSIKIQNIGNKTESIFRKYIRYDLTIKNLLLVPSSFFQILLLLLKTKPTYIISHNIRSSIIPLLAGRVYGKTKLIYFNHGVSYLGYEGPVRYLLLIIEYINCSLANHIIAVSKHAKHELLKLTNTPISVISNGSACGIDLKLFSKKNIKLSDKMKVIKNKNCFLVTFIGRPERRKGFIFIIELWEKYFINEENMKLILCGTDVDINKYTKHPAKNILNMGNTKNIPEILSISNCLLLPSLHEGLPYSIIEAMAMECPIIANNIPSISSQIKNEKNGYLIDGHDHNAYFKKINFIKNIANIKAIKKLTNNALNEVQKFDRKKFLTDYNKKIKDILKSD